MRFHSTVVAILCANAISTTAFVVPSAKDSSIGLHQREPFASEVSAALQKRDFSEIENGQVFLSMSASGKFAVVDQIEGETTTTDLWSNLDGDKIGQLALSAMGALPSIKGKTAFKSIVIGGVLYAVFLNALEADWPSAVDFGIMYEITRDAVIASTNRAFDDIQFLIENGSGEQMISYALSATPGH